MDISFLNKVTIEIGGVAQLARAFGSYPESRRFESSRRYQQETYLTVGFLFYIFQKQNISFLEMQQICNITFNL